MVGADELDDDLGDLKEEVDDDLLDLDLLLLLPLEPPEAPLDDLLDLLEPPLLDLLELPLEPSSPKLVDLLDLLEPLLLDLLEPLLLDLLEPLPGVEDGSSGVAGATQSALQAGSAGALQLLKGHNS